MKPMLRRSWCLPLLLAAGCGEIAAPETGRPGFQMVPLDAEVVDAYSDFGFQLFERLRSDEPDANLFVSPTSAAIALTMTYNGAAGETRDSMAHALGVSEIGLEQLNAANRQWIAALAETQDPRVDLALANSIWTLQGFPVLPAFYERNRSFYGAEVTELPFDAAAVRTMNDWVSRNTRGRIDRIVEEILPNTVMYLINALYFKGQWTYRFDAAQTRNEPFLTPDGPVAVPLMRQTATLPVAFGDGFRMLGLPYGNGRFSMVLVLPFGTSTLQDFYARLSSDTWSEWVGSLSEREVSVVLPRFRVEWEKQLNETLDGMGMGPAFQRGRADFSELTPVRGVYISQVLQKTFVEVNEEGTEAAAATSVVIRVESGPPEFRFDRPFFFAIQDNATGTVLFLGQVTDPGAN